MRKSSIVPAAVSVLALALAGQAKARSGHEDRPPSPVASADPRSAPPVMAKPRPRHRTSHADADAAAQATSSSAGGAGTASQGQSLTVDSHARAAASPAFSPPLSSSNDTCMGSASVGAAGMSFGLSFGTTYVDDNCMMLKNARELWNMGFRGAAIARMCMDERNRQALETSGVPCPSLVSENERRNTSFREAVSPRAQPERFGR